MSDLDSDFSPEFVADLMAELPCDLWSEAENFKHLEVLSKELVAADTMESIVVLLKHLEERLRTPSSSCLTPIQRWATRCRHLRCRCELASRTNVQSQKIGRVSRVSRRFRCCTHRRYGPMMQAGVPVGGPVPQHGPMMHGPPAGPSQYDPSGTTYY